MRINFTDNPKFAKFFVEIFCQIFFVKTKILLTFCQKKILNSLFVPSTEISFAPKIGTEISFAPKIG